MERRVHALLLPPGPRLHRALVSALDGTGPAVCPLAPDLPPAALRTLLRALAPAAVETEDGTHHRPGGVPTDGDTALLIATSGSTGTPKIVELSGAALRHSATATLERLGADSTDRWLCCLPTSHIAGMQVLVRAHLTGTPPLIHPRFEPARIAKAIASGATHISLVPTQLRRLLDSGTDLTPLRAILLGGAPASPGLLDRARTLGTRVFTTYGMSETCGGCAYDGVPLNGVSVSLTADGRIRLAGPVLFTGYRLRPRLTAAARDGAWFLTPDLGVLDKGRLRVLGRADDVINTGGQKVIAGEVAAALARHPGVSDVAVVGRPDPEWGERVTAVVVPAGPAPSLDELRAWVRETLPPYAAPRELRLVDAIPLLPSGKPDRRRLRAP